MDALYKITGFKKTAPFVLLLRAVAERQELARVVMYRESSDRKGLQTAIEGFQLEKRYSSQTKRRIERLTHTDKSLAAR